MKAIQNKNEPNAPLLPRYLSPLILIAVSWIPYFLLPPDVLFARRQMWLLVIAPASFIVIWVYDHCFGSSAWERSTKQTALGIVLAAFVSALTALHLGIGYNASLVNFSYGPYGFPPRDFLRLARIFVFMFTVRYFAEEIFLRGFVFRKSCQAFGWLKAVIFMLLIQNAVYLPYWISEHGSERNLGVLRVLLLENLIGLETAAVFLISGSVLAGTFFHVSVDFARTCVLADAESSFESLFMFASSSSAFYWIMILNHAVLAVVLWFWASRIGIRNVEAGHA